MESRVSNLKQHQRKKVNKSVVVSHVPYEIVVEILSRLPVKSLLRFRSACKRWRSMIMDPQFASMHLNRSSQRPSTFFGSGTHPDTLSFHSINHELDSIEDIDYLPWKENCRSNNFNILGSCNGLLVICCSSDLFIWNPSTRYLKTIKSSLFSKFGYYHNNLCGLGYNSDIDNYKLVIAFEMSYSEKKYARIFSFKSNSWKEIEMKTERISFTGCYGELATLVNGVPHWKLWSNDDNYIKKIISFDLVEDKFKEVPLSDWLHKEVIWQLLNYKGWLCTITRCRSVLDMANFEVCAMKEYGIKDSWSKIFVIPILWKLMPAVSLDLVPWYLTNSGKILLQIAVGRKLIIYNPKEETCEVAFCSKSDLQLAPFVESFVSPMCFESM